MIYHHKIRRAIRFAIKTHEVYQKQKRKGKDIPYITHPLTVGLILARSGADEDAIIAGILHDTIEDSIPKKKVTREMLLERFGEKVASIVESVSEPNKNLSWEKRKAQALVSIKEFSHPSLLVKSADIISNISELLEDYEKNGEEVFDRFNAPKEKLLLYYLQAITVIIDRWAENPLTDDLKSMAQELKIIGIKNE